MIGVINDLGLVSRLEEKSELAARRCFSLTRRLAVFPDTFSERVLPAREVHFRRDIHSFDDYRFSDAVIMHCRASAACEPRERITRRKLDSLGDMRGAVPVHSKLNANVRTRILQRARGKEGRKEAGILSPFRAQVVYAYLLVKENYYLEQVGESTRRKIKG
jgi:hypothetical protein